MQDAYYRNYNIIFYLVSTYIWTYGAKKLILTLNLNIYSINKYTM